MLIEVYSDGSATVATEPGGWAFVICVDGVKVAEGSGHLSTATNNVAEVTAAIRGLEYVATTDLCGCVGSTVITSDAQNDSADGTRIVLISDSQLTLRWATGEYRCKKWHLVPHVIQLRKLLQKLNAETRWVKGHNGDEHNERCDVLAKAARETPPADTLRQGDSKSDIITG
jgi:ribonuclease HI